MLRGRSKKSTVRWAGRGVWFLALLASELVLSSVCSTASASDSPPSVAEQCRSSPAPSWRFRTASPLAGPPVLSGAGQIIVASTEGYVHALSRKGALLWSYTTLGGIVGAPAVDAQGRVYVATFARQLYAIKSNGVSAWTTRTPIQVASSLRWNPEGVLSFVAADGLLWGISSRAAVLFRRELSASERALLQGRRSAAVEARLAELGLGNEASAVPLLDAEGWIYVPLSTGELAVAKRGHSVACRIAIGSGPGLSPIIVERSLVASSGAGEIAAFALPDLRRLNR